MASTYSDLKFELIATGEQSGSWGSTTNTNIGTAVQQAIVGMATLTSADFTANVATLTLTNTNAAQNARALCLNIAAGAVSAAGTINVPAIQKPYIVINGSSYAVTVKVSGLTGVSVPAGKRTVIYNNGTDVGDQISYLSSLTLGDLSGSIVGTTATQTLTGKTITYADNTLTGVVGLTATQTLTGKTITYADNTLTGVVGTTATQALTNKDLSSGTNTFPATLAALATAQTFTATQTLNGSATTLAEVIKNAAEPITVSATAATGTINYSLLTQSILYYTTNASANWTINLRGDGTTSMNTLLSTGQAATMVFMATQGSTAYYNNVVQVDGTTTGVTTKWLNGAPTTGNINAVDVYTYTVVKTGSAAFTVFASQALFS
jgi:hypothetical protein